MATAGAHAGANSNVLAGSDLFDPLSGNAVLSGIPVELARVGRGRARPDLTHPSHAPDRAANNVRATMGHDSAAIASASVDRDRRWPSGSGVSRPRARRARPRPRRSSPTVTSDGDDGTSAVDEPTSTAATTLTPGRHVVDVHRRQAWRAPRSSSSRGRDEAPAPLVFVFHGHGGTGANIERKFRIETLWPDAIVVYPNGLVGHKGKTDPAGVKTGWQTRAGEAGDRDLAFYDTMLTTLRGAVAGRPEPHLRDGPLERLGLRLPRC